MVQDVDEPAVSELARRGELDVGRAHQDPAVWIHQYPHGKRRLRDEQVSELGNLRPDGERLGVLPRARSNAGAEHLPGGVRDALAPGSLIDEGLIVEAAERGSDSLARVV